MVPKGSHPNIDVGVSVSAGDADTAWLTTLSSLGKVVLYRCLECQKLLYAGPLFQALKVCDAVLEAREIDLELPRTPLAPEEVRIGRREVIEEEITAAQKIIGNLEQLHQICGRKLLYALFGP
jgi:hypothetical protein